MSFLSENVIPGNHGKIFGTNATEHKDMLKIKSAIEKVKGVKDVLMEEDVVLVNSVSLESISTAGSAGFLLIFATVNYIGFKKNQQLKSNKNFHIMGAILCMLAFVTLLIQQMGENRLGVAIAVGIIFVCFLFEFLFKKYLANKA